MLFLDDIAYYLTDCGCIPLHLARLASLAYNIIRVLVPVVLILVGMITLTKSILGQKDDDLKKAQTSVIKKVVAAVIVFLVMTSVQFTLNMVSGAMSKTDKDNMWECVTYMLTGEGNIKTSENCNVINKDIACIYNPVTFGDNGEVVDSSKEVKFTGKAEIGAGRTYTFNGTDYPTATSTGKLYTEVACPKYWVRKTITVGGSPSTYYYAYESLSGVEDIDYALKRLGQQ